MFAREIAGMTDASATRRFWMSRSRQCWSTEEEHRLDVMFHPERWLLPELAPHPAHLAHQPAGRLPGVGPRAGDDQHVPGPR
jgi:hypothetical protein